MDAPSVSSSPNAGTPQQRSHVRPRVHDAACDQCRSKKIRCNREQPTCLPCSRRKSTCTWGNKGRKTNQITDGFQGLDSRLNTIEVSLQSIMQFLQPSGISASLRNGFRPHQNDQPDYPMSIASAPTAASAASAKVPSPATHKLLPAHRSGQGTFYGNSSLQALVDDVDAIVELRLSRELPTDDTDPAETPWGSFLAQRETACNELARALSSDTEPYIDADISLTLPPQQVLEAVIEPYFLHIESEIPLLGRTRCMAAIAECYNSSSGDVDPAWKVIFNYIMIQCFLGRYMPLERPSKDIDFLLTKEFELPFLASLWAAFSQLSLFMKPSFANVQALVALTVIAQRYFSATSAKASLHLACFVAKTIGLHRNETHASLTLAEIEERRRVFWALFTIDKELTFVLGLAPCLPSYDCDIPLPDAVSQYSLFRARFAQLTESIYATLYSALAAKKDPEHMERDITQLETELQSLAECDALKYHSETDVFQRESQYIYCLGGIMILRRSKDRARRERCAQEARKCVSHLIRIRDSDTTIGGFMVLRRPFQWRPPMPFFETISSIFKESDLSQQHERLLSAKAFVDALRSVAWTDDAASYCGTLLQVAETVLELARAFVQVCEVNEPPDSEDAMSIQDDESEISFGNAESE